MPPRYLERINGEPVVLAFPHNPGQSAGALYAGHGASEGLLPALRQLKRGSEELLRDLRRVHRSLERARTLNLAARAGQAPSLASPN